MVRRRRRFRAPACRGGEARLYGGPLGRDRRSAHPLGHRHNFARAAILRHGLGDIKLIRGIMEPTDTSGSDYFHRVVDCQWACPAHTDVPEYIRLIAQGEFTQAYMVNRESNVFPGILGRVCDRPCEPACRRGRIEEKPVAICRLKRVAADHRDDVTALLPKAPREKNGKRIACIGAGPASLTVANDLLPLGYEVTIFEQYAVPGGLMRTNIPAFRLPAKVLDEEIGYIVGMGADLKLNSPVKSMRQLRLAPADSTPFSWGRARPRARNSTSPAGATPTASNRHHLAGIRRLRPCRTRRERVLIIGVGNTAMDCCRSSLRLGAKNVKVMARKPRSSSSLGLGIGGRRARERRNRHQSRAEILRDGGRAACRA